MSGDQVGNVRSDHRSSIPSGTGCNGVMTLFYIFYIHMEG